MRLLVLSLLPGTLKLQAVSFTGCENPGKLPQQWVALIGVGQAALLSAVLNRVIVKVPVLPPVYCRAEVLSSPFYL